MCLFLGIALPGNWILQGSALEKVAQRVVKAASVLERAMVTETIMRSVKLKPNQAADTLQRGIVVGSDGSVHGLHAEATAVFLKDERNPDAGRQTLVIGALHISGNSGAATSRAIAHEMKIMSVLYGEFDHRFRTKLLQAWNAAIRDHNAQDHDLGVEIEPIEHRSMREAIDFDQHLSVDGNVLALVRGSLSDAASAAQKGSREILQLASAERGEGLLSDAQLGTMVHLCMHHAISGTVEAFAEGGRAAVASTLVVASVATADATIEASSSASVSAPASSFVTALPVRGHVDYS
jgi:hypothetical protein